MNKLGKAAPTVTPQDILTAVGASQNVDPAGLITPPYAPEQLIQYWETSAGLGPNIDALITNVDRLGARFEPAINLDAPDAHKRVAEALVLDQLQEHNQEAATLKPGRVGGPAVLARLADLDEPTPADVEQFFRGLQRLARIERSRLRTFFDNCCPGTSFVKLRCAARLDATVTGNAYIEVVRDRRDRPVHLLRASAVTMRLVAHTVPALVVDELVRVSDLRWDHVKTRRAFGRYAQISTVDSHVTAYFKELGDPRVVSQATGRTYDEGEEGLQQLIAQEGAGAKPATEILHLIGRLHPSSPYGVPPWTGALLAVKGSREAEELNVDHFESNAVPPLMLLVSGGLLGRRTRAAVEEFFESDVRGRGSHHRVAILEAEPSRRSGAATPVAPKIDVVRLRDAMQADALFTTYDDRNLDKIGMSFRIPRILVGRDRAMNRATAEAALRFAEEQVFEPERADFDDTINRRLLPLLGISFWRFRSNGPVTRDPFSLATVLGAFVKAGAISPNEVRKVAAGAFNSDFPPFKGKWADTPLPLLLGALQKLGQQGGGAIETLLDDVDRAVQQASGGDAEVEVRGLEPTQTPQTRSSAKRRARTNGRATNDGSSG